MNDTFALSVDGEKYTAWKQVVVTLSMEQLAGTFSSSITEQFDVDMGPPRQISEGDDCAVLLNDNAIIEAWVDETGVGYDARTHRSTVSGRSKVADLVDCAAVYKSGQWKDRTIEQIAKDLVKPFGCGVKMEAPAGANFARFALADGETCFDTLTRAARLRGLLLMSDGGKNVVFTRAGTKRISTKLEYGVNIKAGNRTGSMRERYSDYIVKGQSPGTDDFFGASAAQITGTAKDGLVKRYRPVVVMAEDECTTQQANERAIWERNTRAGRSQRLSYVVKDWTHDGQELWMPNRMVQVYDPLNGIINQDLIIVSVTFERSGDVGTITRLELTGREAFTVDELPKGKAAPKKNGSWNLFDHLRGAR
jgi:prophage tail gpP-like protein